jgi:hypothetical protein
MAICAGLLIILLKNNQPVWHGEQVVQVPAE